MEHIKRQRVSNIRMMNTGSDNMETKAKVDALLVSESDKLRWHEIDLCIKIRQKKLALTDLEMSKTRDFLASVIHVMDNINCRYNLGDSTKAFSELKVVGCYGKGLMLNYQPITVDVLVMLGFFPDIGDANWFAEHFDQKSKSLYPNTNILASQINSNEGSFVVKKINDRNIKVKFYLACSRKVSLEKHPDRGGARHFIKHEKLEAREAMLEELFFVQMNLSETSKILVRTLKDLVNRFGPNIGLESHHLERLACYIVEERGDQKNMFSVAAYFEFVLNELAADHFEKDSSKLSKTLVNVFTKKQLDDIKRMSSFLIKKLNQPNGVAALLKVSQAELSAEYNCEHNRLEEYNKI